MVEGDNVSDEVVLNLEATGWDNDWRDKVTNNKRIAHHSAPSSPLRSRARIPE